MYTIFLCLLLALFVVIGVMQAIDKRRRKKAGNVALTEKTRCKEYRNSILFLWCVVAGIVVLCLIGNISLHDLGLRMFSFGQNIWFTALTLGFCGIAMAFLLYQTISLLTSAKAREKANGQIKDGEGAGMMIPRTKKEKRWFSLLSFSAGVCEEIIYRGFLLFLIQAIFPGLPVWLMVLIPSAIFGLGHFYQGVKGMLMTGAIGAVFMCVFLVTDSLLLCMALHFLMDFSSVCILSDEPAEEVAI
jgi:membrane protease YdiL (CAAX protease family)